MIYLSLFSGIEAATVAWEPLGWEPVAFAEIEPFPAELLSQRHPGVPNLGDVSCVDWTPYCGKADVVVGGSPCQAFSVAGLRKSLEDPRGNLTLEYVRSVHAIRPRYAVWENVPGVLSTSDNAFGCFLAALIGADEALEVEEGWPSAGMVCGPSGRAAWRLLDAQWFGLAQRRLRVFVIFCPGGGADPGEVLFERPRLLGNPPARGEAGQGVTGSLAARTHGGGGLGTDFDCAGGLQAVPDIGFALNAKGGGGRIDGESETFVAEVAPSVDASYGRLQGQDNQHINAGGGMFVATFQNTGQGWWNDRDTAATLRTPKDAGLMEANVVAHSLRADGFDASEDGWVLDDQGGSIMNCYPTSGPTGTLRRETHGNIPAIAYNLRGRDGGSMPEPTDVASIRAASGGSSRTYVGVRRLTPTECERLQGFPDGYTAIPFRGKPAADGPRYKALGNSMAVPVMRWIGERIMAAEKGGTR